MKLVVIKDEQILQTMKNIKNFCHNRECHTCCFYVRSGDLVECQFKRLGWKMLDKPCRWDMDAIEEIIKL